MRTSTVFDSIRESRNLRVELALLMQQVKCLRVNRLCFKYLMGISSAVALFEGNSSTLFTICSRTSCWENLACLLRSCLILKNLGDCETFSKCFEQHQYFLYQFAWTNKMNPANILLNQNKDLTHQAFSYSLAKFLFFLIKTMLESPFERLFGK